ncbi:AsmA family protein [Bauldia sp.]|uniref:AsmA family protein n=1 Tax=Bauldia sp. TaxID=2575872 RepID=UPI003BA9DDF6
MRKLLIGLLALVVIVVGGLLALPLFISSDAVKNELIARIEAATGQPVRIDGPVSVSVLPTASLSAEGIGFGAADGGSEAFTVDSVAFGLSLIPLISGEVEIDAVTIERPRIVVAVDETGATNWDPAPVAGDPQSIEALIESTPGGAEAPVADALTALERLTIRRVNIVDGTLIYQDVASGTTETVEALTLEVSMPEMVGAGSAEGQFTWGGQTHQIALSVGERPVTTLLTNIPVELTLGSASGSAKLAGTALTDTALFTGGLEASGDSLAGFLAGFGAALPEAPAFADFELSGSVAIDDANVLVEALEGEIGGTAVAGGMRMAYDRARPGIGLKLALGRLDTAALAPAEETEAEDEPLDLSALGLFDLNADITAAEIVLGDATLTDLGADVSVAGGVLTTTIRSVTVSGAPGNGTITVDARDAVPAISGTLRLDGLDVGALAALAGTQAPVTGTAGLDVAFRTAGAMPDALIANLEASGSASLTDGTATGLEIADYVGGDAAADRIDDIDVTARFESLGSPVSLDGALTWRDERFTIAARANARALVEGAESEVSLNASSNRVNFGFAGVASADGFGTGKVAIATPSLRDLLAWIGQPIAPGGGLAAFSIDGTVALAPDRFTFDKTAFSLDASRGIGTGEIVFADKPEVKAGLAMSVLDVTPYLEASGATTDAGSGDAAIDFGGLGAVDASLNLRAESIIADTVTIGPSALTVQLAGGALEASLTEMALYEGAGTGAVRIDGAGGTPTVAASFQLQDVAAGPFLTDAIGFRRVEGRGDFTFALQTAGASQSALLTGLAGDGAMEIRNGAILGINIPAMLQNLSVNTLLGWRPGNDRTDFSEINATFIIANGVMTNDDLVMAGPEFALNGAGTIDLPAQSIAYSVNPQVANRKGQLKDYGVPVRIEGPLGDPKIYPEVQGIIQNQVQGVLEDPEGALDQIRNVGGDLFGGGDNKKDEKKADKKKADQDGGKKKDDNKKKSKKKDKKDGDEKETLTDQVLDLLQNQ